MPTDLMNPPTPPATALATAPAQPTERVPPPATEQETRSVNIRGLPYAVWQKARQNALASNLPFKEYVIRVLAESEPFSPAVADLT